MRVVERKMPLHECQNELFAPYREPCFSDTLDEAFFLTKGISHIMVLDLAGAFVGPESREFFVRVQQLVERGERIIVVNVAAVTKVDSMGLGELIRSMTILKRIGGMLPLVNPPQHFRQLVASMKFL